MEVRSNGGADFKALGVKFRKAGKDGAAIRKATTKTVRGHLEKIVDEQKHEAQTMTVKGTRGHGSRRREQFHGAHRKRALRGGHGLRRAVARGIKSKVAYTGYKLGARITVDSSALPSSQRKLPRNLNRRSGWRHPVWGNRDRWVDQFGEPFFDDPIRRHRRQVRKDVQSTVDEVMRTLQ